jgi:hypothetical protein
MEKKKGIVCFLDVYGYSSISLDGDAEINADRLLIMWEDIKYKLGNLDDGDIISFTALSDSAFIGFDVSRKSPNLVYEENVKDVISSVLSVACDFGFVMRGAAAYGQYIINGSVVGGEAVIYANRFERVIKLPIFYTPFSEIEKIKKDSTLKFPLGCGVVLNTRDGGVVFADIIMPAPSDDYVSLINDMLEKAKLCNNHILVKTMMEVLDVFRCQAK